MTCCACLGEVHGLRYYPRMRPPLLGEETYKIGGRKYCRRHTQILKAELLEPERCAS